MPYRLKVDHENLPPGVEVYVHGLGTFENGKTYDISDDLATQFRNHNSTVESTYEDGPGGVRQVRRTEDGREILEPRVGPALEDAINNMYGFSLVSENESQRQESSLTDDGDSQLNQEQQAAVDASMQQDLAEQGRQQ